MGTRNRLPHRPIVTIAPPAVGYQYPSRRGHVSYQSPRVCLSAVTDHLLTLQASAAVAKMSATTRTQAGDKTSRSPLLILLSTQLGAREVLSYWGRQKTETLGVG